MKPTETTIGAVAQSSEQAVYSGQVAGSSPACATNDNDSLYPVIDIGLIPANQMTTRTWLVAQMLAARIANPKLTYLCKSKKPGSSINESNITKAVKYADAMIAALNKEWR